MSIELSQLAVAVAPAVIASWVTYQLGRSQGREDRDHARREAAVTDLAAPLRALRTLVRSHGRVQVAETDVSNAFKTWFDAYDRHHTRLPASWQHLTRSIRIAVGTVFGATSFVDIRPELETYPLAEPDVLWQKFAYDYIGYILDTLTRWGDDDPRAKTLLDYDKWLVRIGRREPLGRNQAA